MLLFRLPCCQQDGHDSYRRIDGDRICNVAGCIGGDIDGDLIVDPAVRCHVELVINITAARFGSQPVTVPVTTELVKVAAVNSTGKMSVRRPITSLGPSFATVIVGEFDHQTNFCAVMDLVTIRSTSLRIGVVSMLTLPSESGSGEASGHNLDSLTRSPVAPTRPSPKRHR